MALIVEDGTGRSDANSYADLEYLRDYTTSRGIEFPSDDTEATRFALNAMDYIETRRFKGQRTFNEQALAFPRTHVAIDGVRVPVEGAGAIPARLKQAQAVAAGLFAAGTDLMAVTTGQVVKREKVDVIETEFMTNTDLGVTGLQGNRSPQLDALLAPLIRGTTLTTMRV